MRKFGVDPNSIKAIMLTHLHGDHFGRIPFFLLDAKFISNRKIPLVIAGPNGTRKRLVDAMEVMFPGSSRVQRKFQLDIIELESERPQLLQDVSVTPYLMNHPSGAPSLALRIECEGRVVAYSGDTEWTQKLVSAVRKADLFICEAYFFDKKVKYHLDFQTLMTHASETNVGRLVVTHMSQDMLARIHTLPCEYAEDGKTISL